MSEIKHTPGPWKAKRAPHGPIDILDQRDRDVVTVYGGGVEPDSRAANAHLIAAAPEMLEALRECQAALAMMIAPEAIQQTTVVNAYASATAAEAKARAVIAKAEASA